MINTFIAIAFVISLTGSIAAPTAAILLKSYKEERRRIEAGYEPTYLNYRESELYEPPQPKSPVVEESAKKPLGLPPAPQPGSPGSINGLSILDAFAKTRRSTLLIGDTGAGKSVTESYLLFKLFESYPEANVWVLAQKADSFCGLAQLGQVVLFDSSCPEEAITLICSIWKIYDQRRRLPEEERTALSPVRLILADWLSINQSLEELKNNETVKGSMYLSKLADVIYNGRELNVCLLVDLQSYNLAAVGLKADKNSRKNFNIIGLGNYSVDECGMVNDSYGVLLNLISDRYIVTEESQRATLMATFKELHPISKNKRQPIIFCGTTSTQLALLPDIRAYRSIKVVSPSVSLETVKLNNEPSDSDLAISLGEPLATIWLFAKEQGRQVTVREIQRKDFAVLKKKSAEEIRRYLGLLADYGYGEIDEEGKSASSVGFTAN